LLLCLGCQRRQDPRWKVLYRTTVRVKGAATRVHTPLFSRQGGRPEPLEGGSTLFDLHRYSSLRAVAVLWALITASVSPPPWVGASLHCLLYQHRLLGASRPHTSALRLEPCTQASRRQQGADPQQEELRGAAIAAPCRHMCGSQACAVSSARTSLWCLMGASLQG
jgi:hypothetical protein